MPDASTLLLFVPAALLLIVAPGPDILFLVSQGAARGPRAGFATAMGLAAGNLVHTLGAALGLSVLFRTSALAFQALKFAGVAYLLFLAWKMLRSAQKAPAAAGAAPPVGGTGRRQFWVGVGMNVLNPKVALFFLAFLPQFVVPAAGPVWSQMLFLGILFALMVALVFGAIGLFAGRLRPVLERGGRGRPRRLFQWSIAILYLVLAGRLAAAER